MSNPEQSSVIVVIRALLQSAYSDGLTAQQLQNDYRNLEGAPIPFRKFGYKTLEDFLQSNNEFILKRTADGIKIIQKEVQESMHISRFVQEQRTAKKKKKSSHPMARRPILSSTINIPKWGGSVYSNVFSQLPNRSYRKAMAAKPTEPNQSLMSLKVQPPNRYQLSGVQQQQQHQTSNGFNNNNNNNASVPFDRRPTNNVDMRPIIKQSNIDKTKQSDATPNKIETSTLIPIRKLSISSNTSIQHSASNDTVVARQPIQTSRLQNRLTNTEMVAAKTFSGSKIVDSSDSTTMPSFTSTGHYPNKQNNQPILSSSMKSTVSNRLKQFQNRNGNEKTPSLPIHSQLDQSPVTVDVVDFAKTTPIITNEIKFDELEKLNTVEALSTYCLWKGYAQPQYKYFQMPTTHKIQGRVTVNKVIYSTYPNEFDTEQESQLDASNAALEQIKNVELSEKYPYCLDTSLELAIKILECIKMTPNGVIAKEIPKKFQDAYKKTLPDDWFNVITDYPQMFNYETQELLKIIIIYPNCLDSLQSSYQPGEQINKSANIQNDLPSEIILPWNEKHWNVFITNTVSTVEVWARIIGPEYSDKMDSLITDIELDLLTNKQVANQILIGKIYLVSISECWYRVRIEKKDSAQNRALCFFIDVGDVEWFPNDQIHHCHLKFVKFPAQAICLSLFGLEDFAENPNAKQHFDDYLVGKSLIAEILSKSDEYVLEMRSDDLEPKIQTILYDTSSDEDIQLNPLILEKICDKTVIPELQRIVYNHVYISYINDNGDIYCHLSNSKCSLHYINKLIHQLTEGKFDYSQYRYVPTENLTNQSNLYLVYDNNDNKWYRAEILSDNSTSNDMELCKYIDYGMIKEIEQDQIYRLDLLSAALQKYPAQAILVRLNEISCYNENVIARLRGLLDPNSEVIARVFGSSKIPLVNIYKRLPQSKMLCNINDTIRMEQELEISSDLLLNASDSFNSPNGSAVSTVNVNSKKTKIIPSQLPLCAPPSKDEYFFIIVTMASNPSNFTVRPHKDEHEFLKMMANLQDHCKKCNETVEEEFVKTNECYAALNQDGFWYRVIIKKLLSAGMILIYNCDFGDIVMTNSDKLKPLPSDFRKMPQLAISAELYGVTPKNKDWNTEDCTRFQRLTVGKQFASDVKTIKRETSDQKFTLVLDLIDVSTSKDIYLRTLLIEEGRTIEKNLL